MNCWSSLVYIVIGKFSFYVNFLERLRNCDYGYLKVVSLPNYLFSIDMILNFHFGMFHLCLECLNIIIFINMASFGLLCELWYEYDMVHVNV